jgi:hypothetical protein
MCEEFKKLLAPKYKKLRVDELLPAVRGIDWKPDDGLSRHVRLVVSGRTCRGDATGLHLGLGRSGISATTNLLIGSRRYPGHALDKSVDGDGCVMDGQDMGDA